jgi:hypothetical protein
MRKHLLVGLLAALIAVGLSTPAAAQEDNVSGLGSDEGAAGTIFKGQTATTNFHAVHYVCNDPTLTSTIVSAAVADCCIAGDIWRVTIYKGTKAALFKHTANVGTAAGAAAFAPDVYSLDASLGTSVKKIHVIATTGNNSPGGLPAGWTVRVSTNGGGPVCDRKQVVGGISDP